MKRWIAFWGIVVKDMRTYYLKPPNISWGLIFPLAWTGMFFIRSGAGVDILPWGFEGKNFLPLGLDFGMLLAFCVLLFWMSLYNIRRRWIA
jgi:hypothetical protein